jgi:hypothetical protein
VLTTVWGLRKIQINFKKRILRTKHTINNVTLEEEEVKIDTN